MVTFTTDARSVIVRVSIVQASILKQNENVKSNIKTFASISCKAHHVIVIVILHEPHMPLGNGLSCIKVLFCSVLFCITSERDVAQR